MNYTWEMKALQSIEALVILLSANGTVVWMNKAALTYHGWTLSDISEQPFSEMLDKNALPSPLPQSLVFPCQAPDFMATTETSIAATKQIIVWKLRACTLALNKYGILLIGKDVTEMRRAEDKLFELDSIIAQVPGNLYWFDKNNIYLGCNEQSAKILGIPREEVVGKDLKLLVSKLRIFDRKIIDAFIEQGESVVNTGKPLLNIEEPFSESEDGVLKYYLANKMPLRDKQGNVYGTIGISIDITERKELEAKLRTEKEKAEVASRSKSVFIANMSHDIRTPITGILAMADRILDTAHASEAVVERVDAGLASASSNPDTAAQQVTIESAYKDQGIAFKKLMATVLEDIPMLSHATYALLNLCNEILEVVQLESGKAVDRIEIFDLRLLLQELIYLLTPVAQDKQLELSYVLDTAAPVYLKGSRLFLNRILLNLVSNSLKFTKTGFVKIRVKLVEAEVAPLPLKSGDKCNILFTVEDSGIGIPADKQSVIFDHFSRLTSSSTGVYKGSGLGLYTVKRYVEAMRGFIQVESTVNKGSAFKVTLPFLCSDAPDIPVKSPHDKTIGPQALRSGQTSATAAARHKRALLKDPVPNLTGMGENGLAAKATHDEDTAQAKASVLLVEDSAIAAIGIQMKLKQLHCKVDWLENGTKALQMVHKNAYDCIFMDVGLPDFSGFEVTQKIRALADSKHTDVPIIAVTGHATDASQRQACFEAGMQAVLAKPTDLSALISVLEAHVFHLTCDEK